MRSSKVVGLLQ